MARITIAELQKRIDDLEIDNNRFSSENYKLRQEKENRLHINSELNNQAFELLHQENRFLKHIVRVYAKDETLKTEERLPIL